MAKYKYTFTQIAPIQSDSYSIVDTELLDEFKINSSFNQVTDYIELHYYTLDNRLIKSIADYTNIQSSQDSETANGGTLNSLQLGLEDDLITGGYEQGDVNLHFNFLSDPFTSNKRKVEFFIEEISPDRTELRLLTTKLEDKKVNESVEQFKLDLAKPDSSDFKLNFNSNRLLVATNIDTLEYKDTVSVVIKLYQALPEDIGIKSTLTIAKEVSDPATFNAIAEVIPDEIKVPFIKGPNFNIDVDTSTNAPSQYFSVNELFNYPVTNSYYEVKSLFEEKGAELSIDHSDYTNFVNFSSAQERLANFKYKLDLIETYQSQSNRLIEANNNEAGITGSKEYYEGLINNVLSHFDHYDRFLYYESSSFSWPKTNTERPYINLTGAGTGSWYQTQLTSASVYDETNPNQLINTVPEYLREDPNNEKYATFIHMVAQHFDNLWLYSKAVTDKYDGDNRLEFGLSKDLIEDALKNFGVKLYSSNRSTQDLFKMFTGETYDTGSEGNSTTLQIEVISGSNNITSEENYKKQIYKRLYHNLPFILQNKGNERGLRAILNSFGVPSLESDTTHSKLHILQVGGTISGSNNLGSQAYISSSFDKIRIDNTGSFVSSSNTYSTYDGISVLSNYTSINKKDTKYSIDSNELEIGYSPATAINEYIIASASVDSFSIDDILGDPRFNYSSSYDGLYSKAKEYLTPISASSYNLKDFTRLLKFYDNTLFKLIKDFAPARANISTGVIVKPHLLERSKVKQPKPTFEQHNEFTASITIGARSGSHGSSFGSNDDYITSYSESVFVPTGVDTIYPHNHEEAKYNGELSGSNLKLSTGELNDENIYKYDRAGNVRLRLEFINADANCNVVWGEYIPPTPTPTSTPTLTPTPTLTNTPTPTSTPTSTQTSTPTPTPTSTPASTQTSTPTSTPASTQTSTPTSTPASTQTSTPTPTPTPTPTSTPASTQTSTPTPTPTSTQSAGTFEINPGFGMSITNITVDDTAGIPSFSFPISSQTSLDMTTSYPSGVGEPTQPTFSITISGYTGTPPTTLKIEWTQPGGSPTEIGSKAITGNGTYSIQCGNGTNIYQTHDLTIKIIS